MSKYMTIIICVLVLAACNSVHGVGQDVEKAGEKFTVPGNSSFDIEVLEMVDYVCHFE